MGAGQKTKLQDGAARELARRTNQRATGEKIVPDHEGWLMFSGKQLRLLMEGATLEQAIFGA